MTAEGKQQNQRILWQTYLDRIQYDLEEAQMKFKKPVKPNNSEKTKSSKSRNRRQASNASNLITTIYPIDENNPRRNWLYQKVYWSLNDLLQGMAGSGALSCQHLILPGVSIHRFLDCVRKAGMKRNYGQSFHPTFQPTTYPPMEESVYDEDYPLVEIISNKTGKKYKLRFDFKPLEDEEHMYSFSGADAMKDDDFSPYRYKFNNLATKQRQIAWTYRGKDGAPHWHSLQRDKFTVPLRTNAYDTGSLEFMAELAQIYPGLSEISNLNRLLPLNYHWTKDSGYSSHTRFLLPLLEKADLEYFKRKGLVPADVTPASVVADIDDIIEGIDEFRNETYDDVYWFNYGNNPAFDANWKIPHLNEYIDFISHFFNVDMGKYRIHKERIPNASRNASEHGLNYEAHIIKYLLHRYTDAVRTQFACLKHMIDISPIEAVNMEDLEDLVNKTAQLDPKTTGCSSAPTFEQAVAHAANTLEFKVTYDNLKYLYKGFYQRKRARQRYSMQRFPVPFPICQNNEPSVSFERFIKNITVFQKYKLWILISNSCFNRTAD